MPLPDANYPALPQPQFGQLPPVAPLLPGFSAPPRATQRVMPPRAEVTDPKALEYLFDLLPSMRAGVQYTKPTLLNYGQAKPPGIQRRSRWQHEHVEYIHELMELAMLVLNRPLELRDFPAITEALHRKFQGTSIRSIPYPLRGYHTIHSYATRKQRYDTLLRHVLPEMCVGRPQWAPKKNR